MSWNSIKYYFIEVGMLISTSSFLKVWNLLKLILSYILSRFLKKAVIWGAPYALSVEPTSVCNLKCPECPTGINTLKRPRGSISLQSFKHTLSNIGDSVWYLNLYFQGEPMLHPDFSSMVKLAHSKGIYTMTSTNAHHITPSLAKNIVKAKLNKLIISVDGLTQESYEKYRRGGDLAKVVESITNLVNSKREQQSSYPLLVMQFLVFRHNEHEVALVKQFAKRHGIDKVEVKTAQLLSPQSLSNIQPPKTQKLSRYKIDNNTLIIKGNSNNYCWRQWSTSVITWDGKVVPCCYDKDADHILGTINKQTLKNISTSQLSYDFKNKILKNRSSVEICQNCPDGRSWF